MEEDFIKTYKCVSEAPIFYKKMFSKANRTFPSDFREIKSERIETKYTYLYITYFCYTSSQNETIYIADIRNDELGDIIASNKPITYKIIADYIEDYEKSYEKTFGEVTIKRNAKVLLYKDGHGTTCYRIGIPSLWARTLGFSKEDRQAIIELDGEKIIIKKDNNY